METRVGEGANGAGVTAKCLHFVRDQSEGALKPRNWKMEDARRNWVQKGFNETPLFAERHNCRLISRMERGARRVSRLGSRWVSGGIEN